jgi:hypothetical protein
MTMPDRTEELLRLMLERRADGPPPGWLLPGVAQAVRATGQVDGAFARSGPLSALRGRRLTLIAAAAVLLAALAAGAMVAGGFFKRGPAPTLPAVVILPSPSGTPSAEAPSPTSTPTEAPTSTPAAPSRILAKDTIAIVTKAGDGLRVRSAPSVGADSKKLTPLLKAGTRMLIVRGPVSADGYDWYEVRPDNGPFGWVAAGKGGEDWIAPVEASCADDIDEAALWTVDPIDFLVCYGGRT